MGKYSYLKGSLTSFSNEEDYQSKLDKKKKEVQDKLRKEDYPLNATQFSKYLITAKLEKIRLEALVKEESLMIEAMNQLLVEQLEAQDMSSLKFDNGVSLSIKDDVYASVQSKKDFYDWIEETGQQELLTVNYQTMSSLVKGKLIAGQEIPPGISTYFKQSISVRGIKGLNVED